MAYKPVEGAPGLGDVARLKSGGPLMTVEDYAAAANHSVFGMVRLLHCLWHTADGNISARAFWPQMLVKMADDAPAKVEAETVTFDR